MYFYHSISKNQIFLVIYTSGFTIMLKWLYSNKNLLVFCTFPLLVSGICNSVGCNFDANFML